MKCSNCGADVSPEHSYCGYCGTGIQSPLATSHTATKQAPDDISQDHLVIPLDTPRAVFVEHRRSDGIVGHLVYPMSVEVVAGKEIGGGLDLSPMIGGLGANARLKKGYAMKVTYGVKEYYQGPLPSTSDSSSFMERDAEALSMHTGSQVSPDELHVTESIPIEVSDSIGLFDSVKVEKLDKNGKRYE